MRRTTSTGGVKLVLRRETLVLLAVTGLAAPFPACDGNGSPDAAVAYDSETPAPDVLLAADAGGDGGGGGGTDAD